MDETATRGRLKSFVRSAAIDLREVGGFARFAWLGIGASLVVAVALGFSITAAAERHLLDARIEMLAATVADLDGLPVPESPSSAARAQFDEAVRLRLLGGETIQVKLWSADGRILYSDDQRTEGQEFPVSMLAAAAFEGTPRSARVAADDPAHAEHRHLGGLIEVYLPFGRAADGTVTTVFEVEQQVERLDAALGEIRRNVWFSISSGIGALAVFLGALVVSRARAAERRRRQIESLLGALVRAQEEERRRVVGALHDDIGQPLYALMYGLETSRRQLDSEHPVTAQLERLETVARDVDGTLRRELRTLHEASMADAGLAAAVEDLAAVTKRESDLDVVTDISLGSEPAPVPRAVLYRAIREGVTNVRKHADARAVTIRLSNDGSHAYAEVHDDGSGAMIRPGVGLTTTRERLEAIGGRLHVRTRPGGGTVLSASVPLDGAG